MTPTLSGRIQSRAFIVGVFGSLWTLIIGPLLVGIMADSDAGIGDVYRLAFGALVLVVVVGALWELGYHALQQLRWEKDWANTLRSPHRCARGDCCVPSARSRAAMGRRFGSWPGIHRSLRLDLDRRLAHWQWANACAVHPVEVQGRSALVSDARFDVDSVIAEGSVQRDDLQRRRGRSALGVSVAILGVWLLYVSIAGHWGRVGDHWASAVTMIFGSFVAGSTPQGGGAVAFPVFTKLLEVDANVARSFSLCIQAVGMGAASAAIIIHRRRVEWRAVAIALPAALLGFVVGLYLLGRPDELFWPSRLPGAYVKVTFTLIVAAMALVVYLGYRVHLLERLATMPRITTRVVVALAVAGVLGGIASSLVGSGADVIVYLAVVVLLGVSPRVGVPTTVVVMAAVSIVGFVLLGIIDGQLSVSLDSSGDVVGVGTMEVSSLDGSRFDLFGMWLAAAPVVGFGAPIGSWASSKVTDRQLVRFVVALAAAETVSTMVFLDGLVQSPDGALIAYAVLGAVVVAGGLTFLKTHRVRVLGLPPVDLDQSFTRSRLDTGPNFREQLGEVDRDQPRETT